METALREWLDLLLRWIHVIAAIMWIGDSLLFMWIDSHLRPDPQQRGDVAGVTWLIHGGGYYHLEKRLLTPGRLPPALRWFWLEATTTWVSGFLLLIIVYYLSADAFMLDRMLNDLNAKQAIVAGIAMLAGGWFLYDGVWRSRLPADAALLLSFVLFIAISYAATHLLSARAAFLHIGAMLGTIMAANVWVHILPPQRQMVQAAREGRAIDHALGAHAKTRSTHNTYFTFPVIFLMLSHHFPAVYAARPAWLVLVLFVVLGAGARHLMMVGLRPAPQIAATTLAALAALIYLTIRPALTAPRVPPVTFSEAPPFVEVRAVIVQRCAGCHSETTTLPDIASAGGGLRLDTPDQIRRAALRIRVRAVEQQTMPPANRTGITDEERELLRRWIDAGAPIR